MTWKENEGEYYATIPDFIQDISFRVRAKTLPLDHAHSLSQAILQALPWLKNEKDAGIHLMNYPESGNGWIREADAPKEIFFASKRIRLKLRLPKHRLTEAQSLSGTELDIDGHSVLVGDAKILPLCKSATLFSRRVIINDSESEAAFVERVVTQLKAIGINVRKILCGKRKFIQRNTESLSVCSVMLAELKHEESIKLQQEGLGQEQLIGCGIFIPHKSISSTTIED